ncbi:alpha/beta fold hydrolase [Algoriphagus hitonicola]|uniref:Pimeloyl-ACP methyl ester carboxylesterase n=1 Tax=Algoriphagus hitonicola TaxID=435880 RepID=A0A1I2WL11_9BACT|nr:alpha/beta hydrolase [Algoriphagus hitonicola]SFH01307.1 Pimeloyl-ACP methyl ester carboxylesterase [Algoriphagus hitonicola]
MNWLSKTLKILASLLLAFVIFLALLYRSDIAQEEIIEKYSYPESHFIEVDGVNLHVRFLGEGVPIFLIHGSFSSLHTWDEWQRELSPHFMTISVDLPGHGLTGPDELKRYTVEDYGQVILRLAEKLNLPRFHIAGNSMGGAVALQVASTRPDQVLSLNLLNSSGAPRPTSRTLPSENSSERESRWVFRLLENPVFSKILLKCTPKFLFSMNLKEVYGDPQRIKAESVDRYFELMLREGNREATLDRISSKKDSSIDFERLTMPTLIMWGDLDRWIPVNQALAFEKGISGSNLIIFEGVGHVPMEEIPTESVAEYLSFLGVEVRKNYLQAPNYVSYVD